MWKTAFALFTILPAQSAVLGAQPPCGDVAIHPKSNDPGLASLDSAIGYCIGQQMDCIQQGSSDSGAIRISCVDSEETFGLTVTNPPRLKLASENPVNQTLLIICRSNEHLNGCTREVARSSDNPYELLVEVIFRTASWMDVADGCDCTDFKRMLELQENARVKSMEQSPAAAGRLASIVSVASWPLPFLAFHLNNLARYVVMEVVKRWRK